MDGGYKYLGEFVVTAVGPLLALLLGVLVLYLCHRKPKIILKEQKRCAHKVNDKNETPIFPKFKKTKSSEKYLKTIDVNKYNGLYKFGDMKKVEVPDVHNE